MPWTGHSTNWTTPPPILYFQSFCIYIPTVLQHGQNITLCIFCGNQCRCTGRNFSIFYAFGLRVLKSLEFLQHKSWRKITEYISQSNHCRCTGKHFSTFNPCLLASLELLALREDTTLNVSHGNKCRCIGKDVTTFSHCYLRHWSSKALGGHHTTCLPWQPVQVYWQGFSIFNPCLFASLEF